PSSSFRRCGEPAPRRVTSTPAAAASRSPRWPPWCSARRSTSPSRSLTGRRRSQLTYAIKDAIVTHRIWEALRAELHCKSKQHGVDIVAGYEDMRFSAAMAYCMEGAGIGFDVAAHQAWVARKQEPVAAIEAYLTTCDPPLSSACIASGVQLDRLF